jgi:hypothetical protein
VRHVETNWGRLLSYFVPSAFAAGLVVLNLAPWSWPDNGIWANGVELWWVQAMAQAHFQAGPVGATPHLGWPLEFSPWSHPQMGLGFGLLTYILGKLEFGSASASLVALAGAAAMNSAGTTFLLRSVCRTRYGLMVGALSFAFGVSPFVTERLAHVNVSAFYVLPILLGVAVRVAHGVGTKASRRSQMVLASGSAMLSPAWWLIATLLLVGVSCLVLVLSGRWLGARGLALSLAVGLPGVGLQLWLEAAFADATALATRGPWDSTFYGGFLSDLLIGSPWVNSLIAKDTLLVVGTAKEPSRLGLVLVACCLVCLVGLLAGFPWSLSKADPTYILRSLSVASVLIFIVGGIGNLQATLAVLLGGSSPARVWARLSIGMALFGAIWLVTLIGTLRARDSVMGKGVSAAAVLVVAVALVDNAAASDVDPIPLAAQAGAEPAGFYRSDPVSPTSLPEWGAVSAIVGSSAPCSVAQLPQDDFPMPRWLTNDNSASIGDLYYAGFVPYLMAPDFFWSYTSWSPGALNGLVEIGTVLDEEDLGRLAERGFCAILFDGELSRIAQEAGIDIEGRDLSIELTPDFADDRFRVFRLRQDDL